MKILEAIGIWFLISIAFTPLIGYFLSKDSEAPKVHRIKAAFKRLNFLHLFGGVGRRH